jgi:hypothetical protein
VAGWPFPCPQKTLMPEPFHCADSASAVVARPGAYRCTLRLFATKPMTLSQALVKEGWSAPEIVQAILIMATATSLSSVVWAIGINPELDLPDEEHESMRYEFSFL